jgi:hypothetical protein
VLYAVLTDLNAAVLVLKEGLPMLRGVLGEDGLHLRLDFPHTFQRVRELLRNEVFPSDRLAEAVPKLWFESPDGEVTSVRRGVHLVARRPSGQPVGTAGETGTRGAVAR